MVHEAVGEPLLEGSMGLDEQNPKKQISVRYSNYKGSISIQEPSKGLHGMVVAVADAEISHVGDLLLIINQWNSLLDLLNGSHSPIGDFSADLSIVEAIGQALVRITEKVRSRSTPTALPLSNEQIR